MNRLILIGNGFDLAHNMKTSYNDFLVAYLKKCFNEADINQDYEDDLIKIHSKLQTRYALINYYTQSIDGLIDDLYEQRYIIAFFEASHPDRRKENPDLPFTIKVKSKLLNLLLQQCTAQTWVEIENLFYSCIKSIINNDKPSEDGYTIEELNHSLEVIIKELEAYLKEINMPQISSQYHDIFNAAIYPRELLNPPIGSEFNARETLVLSFNYTATIEEYVKKNDRIKKQSKFRVNYIHGRIGSVEEPIIFGFGDELDSDYDVIEKKNVNTFFKFIKSFWYFRNRNYHDLIRFIEADKFQVYIMGHSCGLSDRTMLNTIFENPNCLSIKIFYHNGIEGYTNTAQEISRHFKDKKSMREKIVPFPYCAPMPQV